MCLIATTKKPKVTEKDMTCWKYMHLSDDGELLSPFMSARYNVGETRTEDETYLVVMSNGDPLRYEVSEGFIHAYTSMHFAGFQAEACNQLRHRGNYVVCKCTIPKGTEFFEGFTGFDICARSMRIDRILTEKEY